MKIGSYTSLKYYTQVLFFIVLLFLVLYEGRYLWIPLGFSSMICFMYYPAGIWIERRLGRVVAIAVMLLVLIIIGFFIYHLLSSTFSLLYHSISDARSRIFQTVDGILIYLQNTFGVDPEQQKSIAQNFYENLFQETMPLLGQTISISAGTLAMVLIVPVFASLIYYYRELLVKFILLIVPTKQKSSFESTIRETTITYYRFAKGMILVYLIVGGLNSLGFILIGLPHAIYFGILASLLTFFPYIGIMLGGLAAVIVAMTTFDSIWYPIGVVLILGVVQYLEANLIFPWVVGQQLKLNTLATLLAMFVGGIIWGGAGLILFVPFAAILKILADRVEGLYPLAVLLGTGDPEPGKNFKKN